MRRWMGLMGAAALGVVVVAGCARHEVIVVPNEPACQLYGITEADIRRAVAQGPRNISGLRQVPVKVLPEGQVIRLGQVATVRLRERE